MIAYERVDWFDHPNTSPDTNVGRPRQRQGPNMYVACCRDDKFRGREMRETSYVSASEREGEEILRIPISIMMICLPVVK